MNSRYLGGGRCPVPPVEFKLMRTFRFLHQEREPAPLKACRRETPFLPGIFFLIYLYVMYIVVLTASISV